MKKSKQAYYDKYFEINWNNNIKNTWKGIKSLISLKTIASHVPTVLSLERSTKYSNKHSSDYLSSKTSSTIFLQPTDKEEIANIIFSVNSNKASGPDSIPHSSKK